MGKFQSGFKEKYVGKLGKIGKRLFHADDGLSSATSGSEFDKSGKSFIGELF